MTILELESRGESREERLARVRGRVFVAFWLVASLAIPGAYAASKDPVGVGTNQVNTPLLLVLIFASIAYPALRLALLLYGQQPRLLVAVFAFFFYITQGVVPLAEYYTGIYVNLIDPRTLIREHILALTAAFAFEVAYWVRRHWNAANNAPPTTADLANASPISLSSLRAVSVLSLAFAAYYVQRLGGLGTFFKSRETLTDTVTATGLDQNGQAASAIIQAFGQVPLVVALAAWLVYYGRSKEHRTIVMRLWIVLLLAANLVVNNPISNSRYWFLTVVFGLAFSSNRFSMRWLRISIPVGVLAAVVIFPYSDYFRSDEGTQQSLDIRATAQTIASKDYDQSVMSANGLWYVEQFGHTDGKQLIGSALFFVPRSVWPGKPKDTGVVIGESIRGAGTTNLSAPLWTEFHIDFGYPGLLIGFAFLGAIAFKLDRLFETVWSLRNNRIYVMQILLPFVAGYSLILLRGSLLQSMSKLAVLVGICILLRGKDEWTSESLPDARDRDAPMSRPDLAERPSAG